MLMIVLAIATFTPGLSQPTLPYYHLADITNTSTTVQNGEAECYSQTLFWCSTNSGSQATYAQHLSDNQDGHTHYTHRIALIGERTNEL